MQKIWIDDDISLMNVKVDFKLNIKKQSGSVFLKVAASNVFRVSINGEFIGYGPRRIVKGVSAINNYDISKYVNNSDSTILVEVISYQNDGYYIAIEPPFFASTILVDDNKMYSSTDYTCYRDYKKLRKVERYSLQRNFTESYNYRNDYVKSNTIFVEGNELREVDLPYPSLEIEYGKKIESGTIRKLTDYKKFDLPFVFPLTKYMLQYEKEEFEDDALDDYSKFEYYRDDLNISIKDYYNSYEYSYAMTGFISLNVKVKSNAKIYLIYDEVLNTELFRFSKEIYDKYYHNDALPIYYYRLNSVNIVKYDLKEGDYNLLTIEPYTLKYLRIIVDGEAIVNDVKVIKYENAEAYKNDLSFIKDEDLRKLYIGAQRTFSENSLDYLIDCPSRERGAWLCDTFFSGRAEKALTGNNKIERNTLIAFLEMPKEDSIPDGMIPMVYNVNPYQKLYMPTWAMWLVLELEDYLKRTNDIELIDRYKEKVYALISFFNKYTNEFGLLENLEGMVFIEWSKANDFTSGVNFPCNMLYSKMLKAVSKMYDDNELSIKSDKMRKSIIKLSYKDGFFRDNALRNENNELIVTENISETCQYYVFFTETITKEEFSELFDVLLTKFGKYRDDKKVYPNVYKSNAFIGNMLRLEYLNMIGMSEETLKECKDYMLGMVDRTGTLWEHDTPIASTVHCFQSMVALWINEYYKNNK